MSKWKLNENSINEFLWTCAGVNKNILRLYPSEYAKLMNKKHYQQYKDENNKWLFIDFVNIK